MANSAPHTQTDNARSATRPPRKRARRGKAVKALRHIEAAANVRQQAWAEGGHPNVSQAMTTDLNGREHVYRPEGLHAEHRQERAGETGADYKGRTAVAVTPPPPIRVTVPWKPSEEGER